MSRSYTMNFGTIKYRHSMEWAVFYFGQIKYNTTEKWKFVHLDYRRRNELLDHSELKLPDAANVIVPDKKFTHYLFGGEHPEGLAKGAAFNSRLGYSADNWKELRDQIKEKAVQYPSTYKGNNGYGDQYEQKIIIYGKNGTPANVVVGWIRRKDGTVTMSSA